MSFSQSSQASLFIPQRRGAKCSFIQSMPVRTVAQTCDHCTLEVCRRPRSLEAGDGPPPVPLYFFLEAPSLESPATNAGPLRRHSVRAGSVSVSAASEKQCTSFRQACTTIYENKEGTRGLAWRETCLSWWRNRNIVSATACYKVCVAMRLLRKLQVLPDVATVLMLLQYFISKSC